MLTTMLRPNCNEEIEGIMSKKFIPTLKTEETSECFFFNAKAHNENNMTDLEKEKDKLNKMKYLFPSIPIEKIENILKKYKAISIEEGIEQLKELTLSEKSKKKINKIEQNKQNQFANKLNNNNLNKNINININNNNFSLCRKFIKNLPKKRNYNTLSMTMGQSRPPAPTRNSRININNNHNNSHIINSNINVQNTNNSIIINNNNNRINEQNIDYNNNNNEVVVVVDEKERQRIEERKKKELKTVDEVAKELLESRNENELKEYLFDQLQLLDKKKRIDEKYSEMKEHIDKLNKDQCELRRCNKIVSRGLNKKIVEDSRLGNKVKKLENEINVVKNSIRDHESIGDKFMEALKHLQNNTYFV